MVDAIHLSSNINTRFQTIRLQMLSHTSLVTRVKHQNPSPDTRVVDEPAAQLFWPLVFLTALIQATFQCMSLVNTHNRTDHNGLVNIDLKPHFLKAI